MVKYHILIDHTTPFPKSPSQLLALPIRTSLDLQCRANSSKPNIGGGCKSLASDTIQFKELGHIPMNI